MPAVATDLDRLDDLIAAAEKAFLARTGSSQRIRQECSDVLPGVCPGVWSAMISTTLDPKTNRAPSSNDR